MEREGLDNREIIKTVKNLDSANKACSFDKNKALQKHAAFLSKNKCLINNRIFLEEADEIINDPNGIVSNYFLYVNTV